jgi:hypothetical protein
MVQRKKTNPRTWVKADRHSVEQKKKGGGLNLPPPVEWSKLQNKAATRTTE